MTYGEVLGRYALLNGTMGGRSLVTLTLPRKISLALAKTVTALDKERGVFDEQRRDIIERYADKDDGEVKTGDDGQAVISEPNRAAYEQEMKDLLEADVDVEVTTFDSSELEKCELSERYDILTPLEEARLSWMIEYGE